MLEARDIAVSFGGVRAVDGVSLSLADGEILGLIGPNGSGKSTFLNALSGVVRAEGSATVDGRPLQLGRPGAAPANGVMRTYQTPQTFLSLSCIENVLLTTRDRRATGLVGAWLTRPLMWRTERHRWRRAADALERVGLGRHAEASAAPLSYGQRRLLELATAIAAEPTTVLLDEPAAGLNAAETAQLADLLRQLRDAGTSLLVVEHKIDFIEAVCDRVVVLQLGRVVASGIPADVWRDPRVMDAYLGTVADA